MKSTLPIIEINNLNKNYILRPLKPTFVEFLSGGMKKNEYCALFDINLKIYRGDRVGLMGPNGSGKSTLLRIISGITKPTRGQVIVRGKIVSLIELSAGMHPDQTGLDNIWLNGMLIGMSKEEIRKKMTWIIRYADIGDFINQPVYMYSEGMLLRLAISIAFAADADIFVFDENLFVGDAQFTQKVIDTIRSFPPTVAILIASHNVEMMRKICSSYKVLHDRELRDFSFDEEE